MNWRTVKLGEIVENFSVRAKDIEDYSNLEFCGVSNQDGITISKYAAEDKIEDYKIIEKGCFAYNPYRVNVGSIALLNEERKGLISPAYVIFKTKPETIIDELLLKFLKSTEGLRQIKFHARGTVRQALRFEDLCKIEISIPDFETQKELFEKLNIQQKAGNKITTELSHQLELVRQLRQTFLREAMQGKLVPQDTADEPAVSLLEKIKAEKEKLIAEKKIKKDKPLPEIKAEEIRFEIPSNWTWCRLGDISEQITDGEHQTPPRISEGRMLLSAKNIRDGFIDYENVDFISEEHYQKSIQRCKPEKGDVLIVSVGATIGRSTVKDDDEEFAIVRSVALIKPFDLEFSKFFKFVLDSPILQKEISGRKWGTAQPCLYLNQIKELTIPLPPLAEQKRIVEKLEKLMKFCDELEANIRESKGQAESLLQVALKEALEPK